MFTHSAVGGHLGCFQFWGIINNDAKSVLDYVSWYMCAHTYLVCIYLAMEMLGHRVYVILTLLDKDNYNF